MVDPLSFRNGNSRLAVVISISTNQVVRTVLADSQRHGLTESVGEEFFPSAVVERMKTEWTAKDRSRTRKTLWIIGILLSFPFMAWIEGLATGAALITPMDHWLLWLARGIGFFGSAGALYLILVRSRRERVNPLKRALVILLLAVFGALSADFFIWHAVHFYEFARSTAKVEQVVYPLTDLSRHRSRRGLFISYDAEIDPFDTGEALALPIPEEQYFELREIGAPLCITVGQRRSESGAIEVETNSKFSWNRPARLKIERCAQS